MAEKYSLWQWFLLLSCNVCVALVCDQKESESSAAIGTDCRCRGRAKSKHLDLQLKKHYLIATYQQDVFA